MGSTSGAPFYHLIAFEIGFGFRAGGNSLIQRALGADEQIAVFLELDAAK